jgi:hypothetical protein
MTGPDDPRVAPAQGHVLIPARFALTLTNTADLVELLQAIAIRGPSCSSTDGLVAALAWPRGDVLAGLRVARMRGLITGRVANRSSVELVDIRLKPAAHAFLRAQRPRFISNGGTPRNAHERHGLP